MALTESDVYHLTVVELRQECADRGLDSSGPVRTLMRRLAEVVRVDSMATAGEERKARTGAQTDSVSNIDLPVPLNVDGSSHGSGGDGQIAVLGELLS
jgi:hypothetical protein